MARVLIVEVLQVSDRVAEKIQDKHGISPEQVRAAVEGVGRLPFRWSRHPAHGDRALVMTAIDDEPVLVVLYPAWGGDAHEWRLASAYRLEA